jgi:hypothetical protein
VGSAQGVRELLGAIVALVRIVRRGLSGNTRSRRAFSAAKRLSNLDLIAAVAVNHDCTTAS